MAGRLRVDYPGAVYHELNRGDRLEPDLYTVRALRVDVFG